MKIWVVCVLCFVVTYAASVKDAAKCDPDACSISNDCCCSSVVSPLSEGTAPQLVALTFDEAVLDDVFVQLLQPLLFNRQNPDGNNISATFFVPHEYTNYKRVQDLYVQGFEIGDASVTRGNWANGTEDILTQEFQDQRTIISTFANISIEDIIGGRTPMLLPMNDISINAYIAAGIQYDNSWTSRSTDMYFPYTLDYLSTQECDSSSCPVESHPGFWIGPIIDLQGNNTSSDSPLECNSLDSCLIQGTAEEISQWLVGQVERERSGNRAPLTLMMSSAWFRSTENSYEGFENFLDELSTYTDVFFVSVKQVIDWVKNPVPVEQFQTETYENRVADCININCFLQDQDGYSHYMTSCIPCPDVYPWLGNPTGESSQKKRQLG